MRDYTDENKREVSGLETWPTWEKDDLLDDGNNETDNERIVESNTFEKRRCVVHQSVETNRSKSVSII